MMKTTSIPSSVIITLMYSMSSTAGFTLQNRFIVSSTNHPVYKNTEKSLTTCLQMALTPVGPFCPFRSSAALEMEPRMETLNQATPEFATEMARLQLDMQIGQMPDPERLKKVAKGINDAVDDWENLLARLKLSDDFQTREYAKLTQAHLASRGQNAEEIAVMMRWQAQCMIAMAEGRPPPFPPAEVNVMQMMEEAKKNEASGRTVPSITQMTAAQKISTTPFTGDEIAFQSENVRDEYEALCRDHDELIKFGKSYGSFDPVGKMAYLDQIGQIHDRWDIFFARFSLLGQLNKTFINQCNAFLDSMGLDEEGFRKLLKDTHDIMRKDAERERGLVV